MEKRISIWLLLDSIIIIVFNIFFFLSLKEQQPFSVWLWYAAIHLAYFFVLLTSYLVGKLSASIDYRCHLFDVTIAFFLIELVMGLIFIFFNFPFDNMIISIVLQVLLIIFSAKALTKRSFEMINNKLEYVKESEERLKLMVDKCSDGEVSKKIEKIYNLILSSQIESEPGVYFLEKEIMNEIMLLDNMLTDNKTDNIIVICDRIYRKAKKRNRKLALKDLPDFV